MTDTDRALAVAILAGHAEDLEQAERDGDDELWGEIASAIVEVTVGGVAWVVWLDDEGWTAARPTHDHCSGSPAFGDGDLMGKIGPAEMSQEVVRGLDAVEFEQPIPS